MRKRATFLLIIIFFLSIFLPKEIFAAEKVDLYFFYGQGCPHCAQAEVFLEKLKNQYPQLNIFANEVY
jgi:thiol-disulfide isomerase/thioredoxin